MSTPADNKLYIDKQFNRMRSQLFTAAEVFSNEVGMTGESLSKFKEFVRDITGDTWDNFTFFFVEKD